VLFLTPAPKPAPTLARAGMARHPPRRPPTPLNSSVPASEVPFQSPPRPDRGFCTSPERPPPGAPRIGPRADTRWYERFWAEAVGLRASLARWRSGVGLRGSAWPLKSLLGASNNSTALPLASLLRASQGFQGPLSQRGGNPWHRDGLGPEHLSVMTLQHYDAAPISGKEKGFGLSPFVSALAEPRIPWIFAGGPGRPFFPTLGAPSDAGRHLCRVSTNDKGQDPENQLRELRAWCCNSGHTIAGEYVGFESGRKGAEKRPDTAGWLAPMRNAPWRGCGPSGAI
jgi:hypothetical protein